VVVHDQAGDLGFPVALLLRGGLVRHGTRIVRGKAAVAERHLQRQRKLLRFRLRDDRGTATVADAVLAGGLAHLGADRLCVLRAEVGTAGVEALVPGELLREVLARAGAEEEQVRPDAAGPRSPSLADDLLELLGPIGDPRREPEPGRSKANVATSRAKISG